MTALPTIRLATKQTNRFLELAYAPVGIQQEVPLPDDTENLFVGWSGEYAQLASSKTPVPDKLLSLGEKMLSSLPQVGDFLDTLSEEAITPLLVEFAIERTEESALANAFLDAPWELLAAKGAHLAQKESIQFCPIRRIGKARDPEPRSEDRLNIVFMAAAPRGYDNLDFENEEVELLATTQHMGLDFTCEESGDLDLLAKRVAEEQPDVIHLTCHGTLHPHPILLLENEVGDLEKVTPQQLLTRLPHPLPRLLFSSACETAQADTLLTPLTRQLIRSGAPAALGWAAPVLDNEATLFAAALYEKLAAGEELTTAMAGARFALITSDKLPQRMGAATASKDWHMARLYLGPKGGGALATAGGDSRHRNQGTALLSFLDERRGEVPIASAQEFVGRRRPIQDILREFRSSPSTHAGVLIRGFGRQGKSSLAGRIAQRLEASHRAIIVFGKKDELQRYGAEAILARFQEAYEPYAKREEVQEYPRLREEVRNNPSRLEAALRQMLEGVCQQKGVLSALLIIDDFEKILQAQPDSDHTIQADYRQAISAVIRAFANSHTNSRLLITSRYLFTLPDERGDLASRLLDLPLPPMQESESRKQFFARLRISQRDTRSQTLDISQRQFREILNISAGVPGLQTILFTLALEDADKCEECLLQMRTYLEQGTAPDTQELRDLFSNLTIDALLGLLSAPQRELLRASTLFELPVPEKVIKALLEQTLPDSDTATQESAQHRLTALALWDTYEDLFDYRQHAYALHPLIRPRAGTLTETEAKPLASALAPLLLAAWGGKEGQRAHLLNSEIARLALLGEQAEILAIIAVSRLYLLGERFEYMPAAKEAVEIVRLLDRAMITPSLYLLRVAADRCHQVGDIVHAANYRERALQLVQDSQGSNEKVDEQDYAALLVIHARALVQQGEPEKAQCHLEEAMRIYEQLEDTRSHAITLGDIAGIMKAKGQVDEAIRIYRQLIGICEQLGDTRGHAIMMGTIARIMTAKGQVDEALSIHQEELGTYEHVGDKRGRANVLGAIARILTTKGRVDEAIDFHKEQITIYDELGDIRERASTLGDIARIMTMKGQVDEALSMHQEELKMYEQVGDKRGRAITLGDIARIMTTRGQMDEALSIHQEQVAIYEQLGDILERAIALGDIARIKKTKGQIDEALSTHQEQIAIYEQLGNKECIGVALNDIALIQWEQQQIQKAVDNFQQSYAIMMQIGRLDGICMVGLSWGQILVMMGRREEGIEVLTRCRDGFAQLGQLGRVQQAQALLDQIMG